MSERVCIAVITGAHGIQGAVRLKSFTEDPLALADYNPVEDEAGKNRFSLTILGIQKGSVLAKLDSVKDRNAAESMKGFKLYALRSQLPVLQDEDEFYYSDLIGLQARTPAGEEIGFVVSIQDYGAGDILELKTSDGKACLVVFTKQTVPVIDLEQGYLIVNLPEESA